MVSYWTCCPASKLGALNHVLANHELHNRLFSRTSNRRAATPLRYSTATSSKQHRDMDPTRGAGSPAGGRRRRLLRMFGKKKEEQLSVLPDAQPIASSTRPSGEASDQSLWDRAYEALRKEAPDLVVKYQKLLADEAQAMSTHYLHAVRCR